LIEALSALSRVCIYDRAGYGWSDQSGRPRNSEVIVQELDELLTRAGIEPPYVLVGNSFGSYNVRLYAHRFPQKVVGLVLTDGLHESGMLKMSFALQALKLLFVSGFVIRSRKTIGLFTLLKPELRRFPETAIERVQRSFCRAKHWVTMSRELINLDQSGRQVAIAQNFGTMPIVSIQSASFFKPALWTRLIPLKAANQLRAEMHLKFQMLSENVVQIEAKSSGHFVWTDEPELVVEAVRRVLEK
jgi:pimeloyl-ACP methyl ester carboxylesterase